MKASIDSKDLDALNDQDMRSLIIQYHEKLFKQHQVIARQNGILAQNRQVIDGQKLVIIHLMKKYVGNSLTLTESDMKAIPTTLELHSFNDSKQKEIGLYIKDSPEIIRPN